MDQLARDELRSAFEEAVRSRNPNHPILNTSNSSQAEEFLSGPRLETIKEPSRIDAWKEAVVGRFRTKRHVDDVASPQLPLIELPDRTAQLSPELLVPERRPTFWTDVLGKTAEKRLATRLLWTTLDRTGNKFDWRDKNKVAWLTSMGAGALLTFTAVEATASWGLSPAVRSFAIATTLQAGWIFYESLHRKRVSEAIDKAGFGVGKRENPLMQEKRQKIYSSIIKIEKDLILEKVPEDKLTEEYMNRLTRLIEENGLEFDSYSTSVIDAKKLEKNLMLVSSQYLHVNRVAKGIADGLGAGAIVASLAESLPKLFGLDSIREAVGGTRVFVPEQHPSTPVQDIKEVFGQGQDRIIGGHHVPVKNGVVGEAHNLIRAIGEQGLVPPAEVAMSADNPTIDAIVSHLKDKYGAEKVDSIINNPDFANSIAGEVAVNAAKENLFVDAEIKGFVPFPDEVLTEATINGSKKAARKVMEQQANLAYFYALKDVMEINNGNVDRNTVMSLVVRRGSRYFVNDFLNRPESHDIGSAAYLYLNEYPRAEADTFYGQVLYGFETNPEMLQVVDIPAKTSASELLVNNGVNITNTSADAKPLASAIAANWDTLTEFWTELQEKNPQVLGQDFYYPVSILELNDLVARAENGDQEALRKLWKALKWIPEGKRFRIVKKEYIDTLLGSLRNKYAYAA